MKKPTLIASISHSLSNRDKQSVLEDQEWWETHHKGPRDFNQTGSSPSMECEGAKLIWEAIGGASLPEVRGGDNVTVMQ